MLISIDNICSFGYKFKLKSICCCCCFFSVPSENKRDLRTIEDVQADIQAKKKMKLSQTVTTVDQQPNTE